MRTTRLPDSVYYLTDESGYRSEFAQPSGGPQLTGVSERDGLGRARVLLAPC